MKKVLSLVLLLALQPLLHSQVVNFNMSNSTQTVSCGGTFNFYDSGGSGSNYNNNENFTAVFVAGTPGQCLSITFSAFSTESCCDPMSVYDGSTIAAPLLGTFSGATIPPVLTSTSGSLTVKFTSDGSVVSSGWAAVIACTSCPAPPAYYVQSAGTQTITCPPGYTLYYDSGGPSTNYNNNENSMKTFSAPAGSCLSFSFSGFSTESCCDFLRIYDGPNGGSPLLGTWSGVTGPGVVVSSGSALTFSFNSDGSVVAPGWTAAIACSGCAAPPAYYVQGAGTQTIICPPTYTTFYDSGGPGSNYNNSESSARTFSAPAGSCLTFNFTSFNTESCCDFLSIYDGPTVGAPLLGTWSGTGGPGIITSSGNSLTFNFTSDASVVAPGWTANISCGGSCVGTPPGGTASAVPSSSCGAFNTTLSVSGSTTGCGLSYQWQSATSPGGPYSNIVGATAATYTASVGSTLYFRRITGCGVNTATSAIASASISAPTVSCSLSTYSASATTFSLDVFVGTTLPTTDDVLFNALSTFGFQFCFAGQQFSGGYVSSNSAFVFDAFPCNPNILPMPGAVAAAPGIGTGWSISQPAPTSTDYTPRNAILGPWQDIDPGVGGTMRYATLGVAPNRRFVVSFENVPMFSCTTLSFTGQIKLFETSNDIEVHILNKPLCSTWNGGQAILGLHNYNGTIYIPAVNNVMHNAPTQWTMVSTAYRWTTSCTGASNCAVPLPIEFKSFYGQQMDGVNKLWWETASEDNMKDLIVERSEDAVNFSQIGIFSASGKPTKYHYDDNTFKRGYINYYRITARGYGNETVSTSIYPVYSTDDKLLVNSVYPNPAAEKLSVSIMGRTTASDCSFIIYDQFGNVVVQKDQTIQFGLNQVDLNIASLTNGVYILEIKSPENVSISRKKFSKL